MRTQRKASNTIWLKLDRRYQGQRPHKRDARNALDQEVIDEEVENFLDAIANQAFALMRRTDNPEAIIRSFLAGAGVLAAQFMSKPSQAELDALASAMFTLEIGSGGLLRGSVNRPKKRPIIRRVRAKKRPYRSTQGEPA